MPPRISTAMTVPRVTIAVPMSGCGDDEDEEHRGDAAHDVERGRSFARRWVPREQVGREDDQRELGQLGGLELQGPGAEPSARAVHGLADAGDQDEEQQADHSNQLGTANLRQRVVVDARGDDQRTETDQHRDGLPREVVPRAPVVVQGVDRRRREHHDQTDDAQRRHHDEQRPSGSRPVRSAFAGPLAGALAVGLAVGLGVAARRPLALRSRSVFMVAPSQCARPFPHGPGKVVAPLRVVAVRSPRTCTRATTRRRRPQRRGATACATASSIDAARTTGQRPSNTAATSSAAAPIVTTART